MLTRSVLGEQMRCIYFQCFPPEWVVCVLEVLQMSWVHRKHLQSQFFKQVLSWICLHPCLPACSRSEARNLHKCQQTCPSLTYFRFIDKVMNVVFNLFYFLMRSELLSSHDSWLSLCWVARKCRLRRATATGHYLVQCEMKRSTSQSSIFRWAVTVVSVVSCVDIFSHSAGVKLRPRSDVKHRCLCLSSVSCSVCVCVDLLVGVLSTNCYTVIKRTQS